MKRKNTIPKHLLQSGMTLADRRYRIDAWLGDNGLTIAYKGYDTFRKKAVLIRELFPQEILKRDLDHDYRVECKRLSDEELFNSMKEHMIQRAKKLIRLYPIEGVANVLTYLEERETVYSIEEYVEGQTLEEYLWKRHSAKFLVEDLLKYLLPVMDALNILHSNGMFHGAVYPENIRLTKGNKVVLVSLTNPMEDVTAPQLSNATGRKDAYSPVEMYVPEASKGSSVDIYEVAAIFYRYVTGTELPVYYDRINEEAEIFEPEYMKTRVMKFQSEAIMKGIAIYDFERFATIGQLKEALNPEDIDYSDLNSEMTIARNFRKQPFWYKYAKMAKVKYVLGIVVVVLLIYAIFGNKFYQIYRDLSTSRFYNKLITATQYEQCRMLTDLSAKERAWYTNDYTQVNNELTDEEKSERSRTRYFDALTDKLVSVDEYNARGTVYEYVQVDYRENEVWMNYMTESQTLHMAIKIPALSNGSYEVFVQTSDKKGETSKETIYVEKE